MQINKNFMAFAMARTEAVVEMGNVEMEKRTAAVCVRLWCLVFAGCWLAGVLISFKFAPVGGGK